MLQPMSGLISCAKVGLLPYSGKLSREKNSRIAHWCHCQKISPPNFVEKTRIATKPRNSMKFSPSKFSHHIQFLMHPENAVTGLWYQKHLEGTITSCIRPSHFQDHEHHVLLTHMHCLVLTMLATWCLHNSDWHTAKPPCNQWLRWKSTDWLMYLKCQAIVLAWNRFITLVIKC